ncbi:MAG TPA: hypothetical protein VJQ82_03525 [Terriglobales bacterium]|nr:hypothetical protein [Terriglobales bacterium]
MRSAKTAIWVAVLIMLSSCNSRNSRLTSYYVSGIEVGRDGQLSAVGAQSLSQPSSGSYYFFFHGAWLTSVSHMERNPGDSEAHRSLYLETKRDGRLDRTVKSDVLLTGDFGTVYADKTCFYNRPVQSNWSSVKIGFDSNEYRSAFESPTVLANGPEVLPPLTSVSFVRLIRNHADYTLVSADYEASGDLRSFQVARATGGNISPGSDQLSYRVGAKDARLDKYGIPSPIDINGYLSSHRLQLPSVSGPEESTFLIQFYDFGKLIQQQQLRAGVPISSRWLQPSTTKEEQIIGPECDSRFRQQKSMGLPTTGY